MVAVAEAMSGVCPGAEGRGAARGYSPVALAEGPGAGLLPFLVTTPSVS